MATKIKTNLRIWAYQAESSQRGVSIAYDQSLDVSGIREGVDLPDWRRRVAEGTTATTPLKASQGSIWHQAGYWSGYEEGYAESWSTRCALEPSYNTLKPSRSIAEDALSNATSKCYKVLNRLLSEFSGQVFLGELKETKDLLLHPLRQSMALAEALVKQRNVGKNVAKSWLEFQFGILPVLSDVDAIIDLINGKLSRKQNLTYRCYDRQEEADAPEISFGFYDVYGFKNRVERTRSWKAECAIRFGISREYLDSANKYRADWSSTFRDLSQLPATAWELLPWSFLVDYFVNVSEIIQAATTGTAGLTFVSRSQIMTQTYVQMSSMNDVAASRFHITQNIPRVIRTDMRSVVRDGAPLGIPSVVFSLPGSNIRYLNIAALIASFKR